MTRGHGDHHIVVLGAGYSGLFAALGLARRTRQLGTRITLVNPSDTLTERVRMHQIATGQTLAEYRIPDIIAGTGITFVQDRARALDPTAQHIILDWADQALTYDTLVYAIGSVADSRTVPGVAAHAYTLDDVPAAQRLANRLAQLPDGAPVVVAGAGLTGVELASEIAESHPRLRVRLLSRTEPGWTLNKRARAYLQRALERLGVEIRAGVEITKVLPEAVELADGELVNSAATAWTTGFVSSPLAAKAGLTVDAIGRIVVDNTLRSVSHPSVHAIGDAAAVRQAWGMLYSTCQSGIPTAAYTAGAIARLLKGKKLRPFRFGYSYKPISLGRRDGVVQFTKPDRTPVRWYLSGRPAARFKEAVTSSPLLAYRLAKRFAIPAGLIMRPDVGFRWSAS